MRGRQEQITVRFAGLADGGKLPAVGGHALAVVLADMAFRRFFGTDVLQEGCRLPDVAHTHVHAGSTPAPVTITPVKGRGLEAAAAAQRPEVGPPRNGASLAGDSGERPALCLQRDVSGTHGAQHRQAGSTPAPVPAVCRTQARHW